MSRISLFLLLSFFFFHNSNAQDFSIDDLLKLRSSSLSAFESAVMAKGYDLVDVVTDYDKFIVFSKDDRKIIFGYVKNNHSESVDTVVIFKTRSLEEFKSIQSQHKADPAHPDLTHFITDDSYISHYYIDGRVCLHLRTKHSDYGTLYEVKAMPDNTDKYFHYSTLKGEIDY